MTEYLEFVGGTSRQFWCVRVVGKVVLVVFGRIGTEGQTTNVMRSDAAAVSYAEAKAREKINKGYLRKATAVRDRVAAELLRMSEAAAPVTPPTPPVVAAGAPSSSGRVASAAPGRVSERSDRVIDL